MTAQQDARERTYWYLTSIWACPVCGRERIHKTRQYTPRPANDADRFEFHENYDWCDV